MCLAIPGKIEAIVEDDPLSRTARVSFAGVHKIINITLVPDATIGDYVIVHVGIAISKLDENQAQQVLTLLNAVSPL